MIHATPLRHRRLLFGMILLLVVSTAVADAHAAEPATPNILFIFSDDHAIKAISAYGGPLAKVAPTPHIDQLARQGAVMLNSFCANSI